MNIRSRISKLELARGDHRQLCELSDAELEARIRRLTALEDDVPLTNEMLHQMIAEIKCELRAVVP